MTKRVGNDVEEEFEKQPVSFITAVLIHLASDTETTEGWISSWNPQVIHFVPA